MGMPIMYALEPLGVVDHLHQRLHQHNTFLGILGRKPPNQDAHPNYPDVDISDTTTHYYIDIEVPGIKKPEDISIKWTDSTGLVVSGNTTRSSRTEDDKRVSIGVGSKTMPSKGEGGRTDQMEPNGNGSLERSDYESAGLPPGLIAAERRVGFFRREFLFPLEVEMEKMVAKLDAGLLSIELPKKYRSLPKTAGKTKIQIAQ